MRTALVLLLLVLASCALPAQGFNPVFRFGIAAGGPIPNQLDPDSSEGKLKASPYAFAGVQRNLGDHFRLEVGLQYLYKGARYSQIFRNDTLVELELIPGVKDTIPTFYYATVTGNMGLHHLELPVLLHWKVGRKFHVTAGVCPSMRIAGQDTGMVHVVIGEGGVFDDEMQTFDNSPSLRRFGLVATLGGGIQTEKGFSAELRFHRSLTGVYDPSFFTSRGLEPNNPFQTQMSLAFGWCFLRNSP